MGTHDQSLTPRNGSHDAIIATIRHPAVAIMALVMAIAAMLVAAHWTPSDVWSWAVIAVPFVSTAIGLTQPKVCGTWMVVSGLALTMAHAALPALGWDAWVAGPSGGDPSASGVAIALLLIAQMLLGVALAAYFNGATHGATAAAMTALIAGCWPPVDMGGFPAITARAVMLAALSATAALAAGLGVIARRTHTPRDDTDDVERLRHQIELLRHGDQLAIAMHDTLSNDLTLIASTARRHRSDTDPDGRHDWETVYECSQRAFEQTHGIIDFLAGNGTVPTKGSGRTPYERLVAAMERTRGDLTALGYGGEATVEGALVAIDPEAEREAESLIREIGTNIARHAVPAAHAYDWYVTLNADAVTIRELNDIPAAGSAPALTDAERSGHGLAMHRQRITELGGTLRTRMSDGIWMVFARIPCRPTGGAR